MPVDRYAPNLWGPYQVHGNVWEWCDGWPIPEDQTRDKYNPGFSIDPAKRRTSGVKQWQP